MFSTAQLDIMSNLVSQMRDKGFTSYVAVTNAASDVTYDYDLFIYFSDEEITSLSNYTYSFAANTIKYSIRSGNPSSNNHRNRIDVSYLSEPETISFDTWQFISTNCEFATGMIVPDYTYNEVRLNETNTLCSFLLCLCVMLGCVFQILRR